MAKPKVNAGAATEAVAANLARIRNDGRISVRAMAERSGNRLTPNAVSEIENGRRKVDVDDLVILAIALDVSPATLLMPPASLTKPVRERGYDNPPNWSPETYTDMDVTLVKEDESKGQPPITSDAETVWDWLTAFAPLNLGGAKLDVPEWQRNSQREEWQRRIRPFFAWGKRYRDG